MSFEFIATIMGLVLTAIGLIYTGYQKRGSKKVARGEFFLHLDEMFQQHNETHTHLRPGGAWGDRKTCPASVEEWVAVERYMGLFERINILVEDKIIDIDTVDRLYGYRVINVSENKIIRQVKLEQQAKDWQDFINLRNRILKIREDRSKWWYRLLKFLRIK
jgi:hypothetical protein